MDEDSDQAIELERVLTSLIASYSEHGGDTDGVEMAVRLCCWYSGSCSVSDSDDDDDEAELDL